jgi:hypothetical protein
VEQLEDRSMLSVTVAGGFAGQAFSFLQGVTPPDTQAAVGPSSIGEAVNTSLAFYNKSGGVLFQGSFASLFGSVRVDANDSTIITDPSIHYDADNGRFVISILDLDVTKNKAYLDFAISTNNNPGQATDFIAAQINVTETAPSGAPNPGKTLWSDFDRFGENANAYVFTFNMFTFPASSQSLFDHVQVLAISKSAILSSTPSIVTHTVDLQGWNGSKVVNENLAPVDMHGATASDPMYFIEETSYVSSTKTQLRILKVADILHAAASDFQSFDVTVPTYTSNLLTDSAHPWNSGDVNATAPQLGASDQMQTNDTRMLSAAWMRDAQGVEHLVASQEVGATLARARWYEFVTSTSTATLRQSGDVGAPGASSYFPSIDISPNGTIAVDFMESSSSEYVSMYVTGQAPGDPLNQMQAPVLVQAGQTSFTLSGLEGSPHRAGDFSAIGTDINSSGQRLNTFWAANEYTGADSNWATWLSNFSVAPVPQGPSPQLLDGSTVVPDGTGSVSMGSTFIGTALTKTFTIQDIGTQTLTLTGPIVLPAGFSLVSGFGSTTVSSGGSTTFTVRLDATTPGTYSGQVSFGTNDPNNNPFTFTLSGTVASAKIIDDSNPGYSKTGSWTQWTNGGYLGDVQEATAKTGADVSSWTFSNLLPGQYRVSVTWTPYPDRATNAPYTVFDGATAQGTILINQQVGPVGFTDQGGTWQDLGNFQIRNGSLVVQLSDAANGYVIADAVRIEYLGAIPQGPVAQVLDGTTNVPDSTGSVNLGNTFVGTALTKTFTVKDFGNQTLTLSGPIVLPAGFSLVSGFGSTTLAPGGTTTFTVRFDATTPGNYSGQVSFGTSDPNNNPFTFTISGTVGGVSIIDDSNPGYSTTGSWTQWTNGGYLGDVREATGRNGADVSSWTFSNLLPGQYRVSVTWTPWPDRATNAPYTVLDGNSVLGSASINQQVAPASFSDQGALWQDLGTFEVTSGGLVVQLSDAANGNVIADAVRIQWVAPIPQGASPQVLDGSTTVANGTGSVSMGGTSLGAPISKTFTVENLGTKALILSGPIVLPTGFSLVSGFGATTLAPRATTSFTVRLDGTTPGNYSGQVSFGTNDPNNNPYTFSLSGSVSTVNIIDDSNPGYSTTGSWTRWTNGGYLGDVEEATAKTGADVSSWTFNNLAPGQYRVSVTWTSWSDRATNAPYTVLDGSTSMGTIVVNQQIGPVGFNDAGATWQDLGSYQVRNGSLVVQLSDAANGNVIADAVRLQWLAPLPQGPSAQVFDGTTQIADSTGVVNLGTTFVGSPVTRTITIKNMGTQNLTLSGPITLPVGFSLTASFGSTTVAPGASTSFTVRMDANSPNTYSGQVSFGTNDPNNNPYTFTLSGVVASVKIIDDSNPGYSNTGSWTQWTNGGYLGDVQEATNKNGADISTWTFNNVLPGQYRVSVTWTAWPDRATNATYTVLDGATSLASVVVNQQVAPASLTDAGASWQDLGIFVLSNGTLVVKLSDLANGNVIADAVRLEWIGPPPQGPLTHTISPTVPSGVSAFRALVITSGDDSDHDGHHWRRDHDGDHEHNANISGNFNDWTPAWPGDRNSPVDAVDRFFALLRTSSQNGDWSADASAAALQWLDDPWSAK